MNKILLLAIAVITTFSMSAQAHEEPIYNEESSDLRWLSMPT